jgi:hypothetical protein
MLDLWHIHLSFALVAFLLLPTGKLSLRTQCIVLAGLLLISYVPVDDLPLAIYMRTLAHDVSIVTLLGLGWVTLVRLGCVERLASPQRWQLIVLFGVMGLVLYPATLGMTPFDPYRLGYNPRAMIVVIGALALLMLYWRNGLAVAMLALATLGFSLELISSDNYWDYLLDPFVAMYCWGALFVGAVRLCLPRRANVLAD